MSSPATTFLVLFFFCFVVYGSCETPTAPTAPTAPTVNGTKIKWNDNFEDTSSEGSDLKTKYDAKGLQPWYNFANSFIGTVLSKDPYGLLIKIKEDGLKEDVIKNDIIKSYAMGMIVCVGIGILFCVLMPIVGFCFCCCRCCGKCGGEMSQKERSNNGCKRAVFAVILTVITLLMFTGVLLTFVCNDRMSETVNEMQTNSDAIIDEAVKFINRTVGEVDKLLGVDFGFVINQLTTDITDEKLQSVVGDPLLKELDTVSLKPIEAVKNLAASTETMRNQLESIRNTSSSLSNSTTELQSGLDEVKTNLTEILKSCAKLPSIPGACNDTNPNDLATGANFTDLPDVSEQLKSVEDVVNEDFEKTANEGLAEVRDIPQKVINDTTDTRKDIRKMISNATSTVNKMRDDLKKIANDDVISKLEEYKTDTIPKAKKEAEKYDNYRWMAGVGLTCILLLVVVLMALGLMCGVCGHDKEASPTTRGTVSNLGGLSLMAAAGFCFIFASFLMLLTTICFIIGAPLQTVCEAVDSGKLYSEVVDNPRFWGDEGYLLSRTFFGANKSNIQFTIGGFIENCRQNKPLFKAGPFDQAFNISDRLDIKKLLGNDTTEQFDNLKVNLSDVNVFSNETRNSLIHLRDSGVDDIDFGAFLNETTKGITAVNLTAFAKNISDLGDAYQNAGNMFSGVNATYAAEAYRLGNKSHDTAQALRNLQEDVVKDMEIKSTLANNTLGKAEEAEKFLHTRSASNINKIVEGYTERVLGWGFQFTDHIEYLLNNQLAKCQPVANIYDATIVIICKQALYPFNGFWFSIGYCLFFFIPAIIFCVKLAKHYRRMDYESDFDQGLESEMFEMGGQHYPSAPPHYPAASEKKQWANPK
ncbi:Prominin-1-A [Stylophora pistillata]|uniref:Prominin-1-A n=1 Tax=Stylophora pistillata TaxID=50429 RepID=A0A2B4RUK5_STYPI|nr:Prominin-1-A [Stylophora pistillata]